MIESLMYVQQNDSQMIDQMVGSLGGYFTLSNRWGGQNFDTFNASDAWNNIPYETMFLRYLCRTISRLKNSPAHQVTIMQWPIFSALLL